MYRKYESEEVLDTIEKLVCLDKTDQQISEELKMPIRAIYFLRREVLGISLYGKQRVCAKCGLPKSVMCFNGKAEHKDWCIKCRRKYDGQLSEKKLGRPFGVRNPSDEFVLHQEERLCIRCERVFMADVYIGFSGREEYDRLCDRCNKIVTCMDRVSI